MRSDQEPPPPGGPRFGQPGRPTRESSGRLAQTRGQDRQDYVQHGRGRPSVGETPANTVDGFLASAAPPARDSGCPPNRVNPNPGASDISSPPCLPRLLPAGAVAGRGLHPLEKRRLVTAHVES